MTELTAQEMIHAILRSLKRTGERFAQHRGVDESNRSPAKGDHAVSESVTEKSDSPRS